MRLRHPELDSQRCGVVLIAVLVVLTLLTLAAFQYSELMLAEYKAATSFVRAVQARAAADAGVNYAAMMLSVPNAFLNSLGSNPFDNPDRFRRIAVGAEGPHQAFFSIIAPLGPDDSASTSKPFRFGAIDEAGKININSFKTRFSLDSVQGGTATTAVTMLTKLGIPEDTANAILDWLDADSTPRVNGAENDYYAQQGYRCKDGLFDTLEELLLVRGVTPELLYGNDANRNGILDPEESSTGDIRDLGWQAYLTVYSREQNIDGEGSPRLFINTRNTITLYQKLIDTVGQDMANYLMAYRRFGAARPLQPGQQVERIAASAIPRQDLGLISGLFGNPGQSIPSYFALIGTEVEIRSRERGARPKRVACPLNDVGQQRQLLAKMFDKLTPRDPNNELPGRVNVNTAPQLVLSALPQLTPTDVQAILATRPDPTSLLEPDPVFQTPAWLLTEAKIKPETLNSVERFVTARTQVYRIQAVGHFAKGGPTARVEAVIDTNRGRPRIVYYRDLSELGRGYNLTDSGDNP